MDEVAAVLDRVFPGREPTARQLVQRGNHKRTTLVSFGDEAVVVQTSPDADALATEAALATAVRERTTVPVPEILAVGTLDGAGYLVAARAPGVDLHTRFTELEAPVQRAVARTFGRFLAELHDAFSFDAYGDVRATDGGLRATGTDDWAAWLTDDVEAGLAALPPAFDSFHDPVRTAVREAVSDVEAPEPRLFPWDLRPGNALVAEGAITAVVDWGGPLAADAGLAVAKVEHLVCDWYIVDEGLHEAFREGYTAVRPWPAVPRGYRLAAVVQSAVDSRGEVTRPRYPERTGDAAVAFHRDRLRALL
ncbi:phosphotransferase family protein [Halorarius litoreus]|uniref:phosphotransferase family protein n=1 Tax=Halorarius litoreus TaxID=2962676 RepID=UPI0020CB7EDC|nr:phosphotransferase [Halorarius litoreus]